MEESLSASNGEAGVLRTDSHEKHGLFSRLSLPQVTEGQLEGKGFGHRTILPMAGTEGDWENEVFNCFGLFFFPFWVIVFPTESQKHQKSLMHTLCLQSDLIILFSNPYGLVGSQREHSGRDGSWQRAGQKSVRGTVLRAVSHSVLTLSKE